MCAKHKNHYLPSILCVEFVAGVPVFFALWYGVLLSAWAWGCVVSVLAVPLVPGDMYSSSCVHLLREAWRCFVRFLRSLRFL